jgi:hypothetical protein
MEKIENPGRERILARIRSALSTPRRFDIPIQLDILCVSAREDLFGLVRGQWSEFGQKEGTNPATTGGVLAED